MKAARALGVIAIVCATLASCVTLTEQPRAVVMRAGKLDVQLLKCDAAGAAATTASSDSALDGRAIHVVSWNIHKQGDEGWQRDLDRFAAGGDLVLLQEATLDDELRRIVEQRGFGWVLASSFLYGGHDIGVLTASRAAPLASCTERIGEPLIIVPKSAVISWFRVEGSPEPLAVVNVHAINFALTLGAYEAQLAALTEALAHHAGPIIFAGDFNTWNEPRRRAMIAATARLGLVESTPNDDKRTLFFGKQLDHIMVRGLDAIDVAAIPVRSSDHNPLLATFRVTAN